MKNLLLFLIIIGFTACNSPQKEKEEEKGKEIFFSKQEQPSNQLNLLQNKRYIPLETTDECLLSEITQLFCTSKEMFIFDIHTQSVYVFDYTGTFLRKLHKKGQGPGEYSLITAITINEKTNRLSVVNIGNSILSYDINSFEFINEQKIESIAIEENDEQKYYSYNSLPITKNNIDYKYHIIKYDKKGNIEQVFLPIKFESGYVMRPIYRFYRDGDKLFTYLPYTSNVYEITKDTCVSSYTMKYEHLTFPTLEFLNTTKKEKKNYIKELSNENYVYNVQIFENNDFLISLFDVGKNNYIGLYNKDKKEGFYFFKKEYKDTFEKIDYFQIIGSHNNEFISVIKQTDINDKNIEDKELKRILSLKKREDNPILLFLQLKK
ncbi:MAG: 6-bladed beta-propeller [Parabacteroides sp.]|nr:6-bladed beta-propeller [Parabacteroides sp.]